MLETKETRTKRSKASRQWQLCKIGNNRDRSRDIVSLQKREGGKGRKKETELVKSYQRQRCRNVKYNWFGETDQKNLDIDILNGAGSARKMTAMKWTEERRESIEFALERRKAKFNRHLSLSLIRSWISLDFASIRNFETKVYINFEQVWSIFRIMRDERLNDANVVCFILDNFKFLHLLTTYFLFNNTNFNFL